MSTEPPPDSNPNDPPGRHKRRPRYAGTHPRRFEQRYKELNPSAYPEIHEHIRSQGRTPAGTHIPVLVAEVLTALDPQPGDIAADCTLGYGGHARELLQRIGPTGRLIGLDVDAAQLQRTAARLGGQIYEPGAASPAPISLHRSHFAGLGKVLAREGLTGCDVILADLGASSMQLDDPARGFSYKYDGPLDMRMDDRLPRTAADVLATMSADELSARLRDLADEPEHERIAQAIVRQRALGPITHTQQLVQLILAATGRPRRRTEPDETASFVERHPAVRTFQALRMIVNDEAGGLEQFLRSVPYCLRPAGRIAILSFHSGEHRRVEEAFRAGLHAGVYAAISEEPLRPSPQEVGANPRSRAARLRWARRSAS